MKRVVWLDLVRIFSVFFVIMIHVSGIYWYSHNPSSINWNILNFYDSISRFCVPAFVMISGALFLSKKEINIKKLYSKNILRIVIALVFWALCYAVISNFSVLKNFSFNNLFYIMNSFNNIHYHLYFLLSLLGLYIMTPILKKITDDEKLFKYLLCLSIIFGVIIPTINSCFVCLNYIGGSKVFYQLYYSLTNWLFKINIPYVSGYLVFYLTGYYLFTKPIKHKKTIYILGAISTIFTIVSTLLISIKYNAPQETFYVYNTINVYLMAVAIFTFFKEKISKIKFSDMKANFIKLLSDCIFGVYLTHEAFLILIRKFNLFPLNINYIFAVPLFTILVFVMSFILVYLIRKIPKVHKYIT